MGWQVARVQATQTRAGAALALAQARPSERARLIAAAERDAQSLEREGRHYARAWAALLRAGVAASRGQRGRALRELGSAIVGFDEADLSLHAACARRRKGEILGGDEGRALIQRADSALRAQDIRDVERWTAMYAPGFSRSR
jgi:hypothetical protein